MDLKDVVESVRQKAIEVHNAFHAGHPDVAENYLRGIRAEIMDYEKDKATPERDVTESATSETPAETSKATPAQPAGPPAKAPGVVPFVDPPKILPASQFAKPNQ